MKFVYWMGLQSPLILDKKPILKHIILSVAGRAEWTLCGGHEAGHRRAESPLCRAQPARGNFAADKSLTIDWIRRFYVAMATCFHCVLKFSLSFFETEIQRTVNNFMAKSLVALSVKL